MAGGSVCKSCGSLLPLPDGDGNVSCLSCGRTERVPAEEPAAAPGASTGASGETVFISWKPGDGGGGASSSSAGRRVGCIVAVAILAVVVPIIVVLAGVLTSTTAVKEAFDDVGATGTDRSSFNPAGYEVIELPVTDGGGTEVVTVAYDGQKGDRFIARVALAAGGGPDGGWASEPFPKDVYDARMLVSGPTLFAAVGDELWALVAETGVVSWKAPLSDVVHVACDSCFQPLGDGVVVSTADGQVFAYGPGSAQPLWGHRLVSDGSPLHLNEAGVAVIDDVPDGPGRKQVVVLDPVTGAVVSSYAPTCQDGTREKQLSFTDSIYAIEGSTDLIATISMGGTCLVRWNGANGQQVWSAPVDIWSLRDLGILSSDHLYVSSDDGIVSVDLATGSNLLMAPPPDSEAEPLFRSGDLLVSATRVNRGSAEAGLAGYEAATGQLRWSFPLPGGGEPLPVGSRSSEALHSDDRSVVFDADGRLMVATFSGEARTVTFRSIELASGVLGEPSVVQLPEDTGTPSVTIHRADSRGLLITIDRAVVRVPLSGDPVMWP